MKPWPELKAALLMPAADQQGYQQSYDAALVGADRSKDIVVLRLINLKVCSKPLLAQLQLSDFMMCLLGPPMLTLRRQPQTTARDGKIHCKRTDVTHALLSGESCALLRISLQHSCLLRPLHLHAHA